MKIALNLIINGKQHELDVNPNTTLAELLRNELGLTGSKVACDIGACGSCTVLLDRKAVRSCSILAPQAEGRNIVTIEGLANGDQLHPIQESFIRNHGLQCGFCTPGMILEAKALLDENPKPSDLEVREALDGHICRCGTYPNIVKSILDAAKVMRGE
ncbi:(2Fe-2S)-binding protein [Chloroflexota bacterium]